MDVTEPLHRVRYARRKGQLYQQELDAWQMEHAEARLCYEVQDLIRDINRHFDDILRIDRDIRGGYANGAAFDASLEAEVFGLMEAWVVLGRRLLALTAGFEARGFAIDGTDRVRSNYREAAAIVGPEPAGLAAGLADLRDRALQEYRAGQTTPGLVER